MRPCAWSRTTCRTVVITGAGHWVAEEAPDQMLKALTDFFEPYRQGQGASHEEPAVVAG